MPYRKSSGHGVFNMTRKRANKSKPPAGLVSTIEFDMNDLWSYCFSPSGNCEAICTGVLSHNTTRHAFNHCLSTRSTVTRSRLAAHGRRYTTRQPVGHTAMALHKEGLRDMRKRPRVLERRRLLASLARTTSHSSPLSLCDSCLHSIAAPNHKHILHNAALSSPCHGMSCPTQLCLFNSAHGS